MKLVEDINQAKILIVEDERHINRLIELILIQAGFHNIKKAYDGFEALNVIKNDKPDLVLLDVMLPNIDGFSICKQIKNNPALNSIQVIMLTARKMEEDILQGFENGAIDYISKPFSNKILLARINAHLKNSSRNYNKKIYQEIILDSQKNIVEIEGLKIDLTNFEFKILEIFISNAGIVFSRAQLLSYLRGDSGFDVSERAIDVQILNLRRKLGKFGENIETVRGVGYKLKE